MKMAQPPLTFLEAFWKMQRKNGKLAAYGILLEAVFLLNLSRIR